MAAALCLCNHATVWHIGVGRCVVSGCRCEHLYRPSRFELMTDAEKTAHLDEMFMALPAAVVDQYAIAGGGPR